MQTTQVTVFGCVQHVLLDTVSEIRSLCDKKGIEYKGPHPQPKVDLDARGRDLGEDGVKLFGEVPTEREIHTLSGTTVLSRSFRFHRYASDDVLEEIVKREYPDEVFLRVKVRETEFIGADNGFAPFTYDPKTDYNTEL